MNVRSLYHPHPRNRRSRCPEKGTTGPETARPWPGPGAPVGCRPQFHRHLFPHRALSGQIPVHAGRRRRRRGRSGWRGRDKPQAWRPRRLCRIGHLCHACDPASREPAALAGRHQRRGGRRRDAEGPDGLDAPVRDSPDQERRHAARLGARGRCRQPARAMGRQPWRAGDRRHVVRQESRTGPRRRRQRRDRRL